MATSDSPTAALRFRSGVLPLIRGGFARGVRGTIIGLAAGVVVGLFLSRTQPTPATRFALIEFITFLIGFIVVPAPLTAARVARLVPLDRGSGPANLLLGTFAGAAGSVVWGLLGAVVTIGLGEMQDLIKSPLFVILIGVAYGVGAGVLVGAVVTIARQARGRRSGR